MPFSRYCRHCRIFFCAILTPNPCDQDLEKCNQAVCVLRGDVAGGGVSISYEDGKGGVIMGLDVNFGVLLPHQVRRF